ncbi:glycoside hydrolase family 3 N-terminal domain-containing protein [Maritalea mediterranea]|uniref:beta-N-acetylhexosaminidase n=1 Tax=Maritalea mediterranea TaxID=2909667 RepID=A0ABS9E9G9_9HYPH|nr:glycoside hydrolase family 3 N-terminal domain-containing protein [Maritalea mediterranea]MCF4098857.1 glycoside hydrolase family 3 protein [Maritalea mediterranea]
MRLFLIFSIMLASFSLPAHAQSLRDMAGQMVMIGFQGDQASGQWHNGIKRLTEQGKIGGVLYLKYNVAAVGTVKQKNADWQAAAPANLPLLIAIDQEGGKVERLTKSVGFAEIASAEDVAKSLSLQAAQALYEDLARRLASLGFNINFGPVVDVNVNRNNPIIAKFGRSFSADPEVVADYAAAFVRGHKAAGVLTALKHFPGHGSSQADSHLGFADISTTWRDTEYEPYQKLIGQNLAQLVMVGHLYHKSFAEAAQNDYPASLSSVAIDGVLRQGLGFDGVVVSDDLEMGAITEHYGFKEAVLAAVRAGNDILLFSNTREPSLELPDKIINLLVSEAERDPAFAQMIERSYRRIVGLKARL